MSSVAPPSISTLTTAAEQLRDATASADLSRKAASGFAPRCSSARTSRAEAERLTAASSAASGVPLDATAASARAWISPCSAIESSAVSAASIERSSAERGAIRSRSASRPNLPTFE
eukprot:jgi/Chrpa1/8089/Chrysochromulina_OHIO_Genome00000218-RA